MTSVQIRKVETKKELKTFIDFHYDLYKGNKYDVPTLFSDDWNTLSKDKNAAFEFCQAEYYLAYKGGKVVGRVAAIINHKANKRWKREDVRFGWIDFIDDMDVSKALLEAVESYGRANGMKQVVGPLGFTDFDPEGMLTEGFDQLGTMSTIYNYPYYPEHLKKMGGWVKDNDYVEFKLLVPKTVPEKYIKLSEMVEKRYNLHVRTLTKKEINEGGYGHKIFRLINDAYAPLFNFSRMTERQIDQSVKMYVPVLDLRMVTLVENDEGELVAVGISMPSLSKALQKAKGKLLPLGWWHLLKALFWKRPEALDLLLVAVRPDYQGKGVSALLFTDLIPIYKQLGFVYAESNPELEQNDKVQSQWQYFKTEQHKRRRCYRKDI